MLFGGLDMRKSNWYPHEIYRFMFNLAHDNSLAIDEVAFMLLREVLASHGFVCDHSKTVGFAESTKKPYCKHCYTRLELVTEKVLFKGKFVVQDEYRPKETFVDIKRKEDTKNTEVEFEVRVKAEVDARIKALLDSAVSKEDNKVR